MVVGVEAELTGTQLAVVVEAGVKLAEQPFAWIAIVHGRKYT